MISLSEKEERQRRVERFVERVALGAVSFSGDHGPVDEDATGPGKRMGFRVSASDPWWWLTTFVWGIVAGMMLVLIALGLR